MEPRTNADYLITDSIHIGKTEFVIGENQTRFGTMYVTWECKNGDNYFWGHYMDSRGAAEKDLWSVPDRSLKYSGSAWISSRRKRSVNDSWMSFLTTAASNYKYKFKDQILIHAQKPNATACAEIETWNRLGRWVNKGTKGIALLSDKDIPYRLRHVFDVTRTNGRRESNRSAPTPMRSSTGPPRTRQRTAACFKAMPSFILLPPQHFLRRYIFYQYNLAGTYEDNRPCMYRLFFCYSCYQNVVTAQQKNGAYKICFQNIRDKSRRKREIAFFVPHNKSNGVRLIFSKSRCYSCCKNVIKLDGGAK